MAAEKAALEGLQATEEGSQNDNKQQPKGLEVKCFIHFLLFWDGKGETHYNAPTTTPGYASTQRNTRQRRPDQLIPEWTLRGIALPHSLWVAMCLLTSLSVRLY